MASTINKVSNVSLGGTQMYCQYFNVGEILLWDISIESYKRPRGTLREY